MESPLDYAVRKKRKLKEPEDYQVVFLNDDWTPMDFVVSVLIDIFHKSNTEAEGIMMAIHKRGRGVAGIYPFDIAKTKAEQVHVLAGANGHPLSCIVEKAF
ncbi:MAG: ATP-dependent Clp protease adaptor ClpS [Spirochaetaceae bacterium]|jgi:ATP-dependent Clp protease adaptor protein ClpS|nr:ATP-dependent Clp protease adaptor ClpS [Spirochaetaceae bacterium]GMO21009.1 MAG: ATP-dependent Clp protease adapter ClpS [Termitinemataceae bacterium]